MESSNGYLSFHSQCNCVPSQFRVYFGLTYPRTNLGTFCGHRFPLDYYNHWASVFCVQYLICAKSVQVGTLWNVSWNRFILAIICELWTQQLKHIYEINKQNG